MELVLVLAMVFFGTWATCQKHLAWRIVSALMLAGLGAQLLYLFAARQNLWLPPLAILSPGVTALGLAFMGEKRAKKAEATAQVEVPAPEPAAVSGERADGSVPSDGSDGTPAEEEPPKKPARKAAKKAARKTAAKKAAKNAPAKKAARKKDESAD